MYDLKPVLCVFLSTYEVKPNVSCFKKKYLLSAQQPYKVAIAPFYKRRNWDSKRLGNWHSKRLGNLSKVIQLVSGSTKICTLFFRHTGLASKSPPLWGHFLWYQIQSKKPLLSQSHCINYTLLSNKNYTVHLFGTLLTMFPSPKWKHHHSWKLAILVLHLIPSGQDRAWHTIGA